jgi:hypothetical protein
MICSSLNLLRFIPSDSFASDSTQNRSHFRGARQEVYAELARRIILAAHQEVDD